MTIQDAKKMVEEFYEKTNPNEQEEFLFREACDYLIQETSDPGYMMELGGYYYRKKRFELALKYYEMAAGYDYSAADDCLGYIWYYGRCGKCDYEKAFYHFSRCMDRGDLKATYKVADMYKNGYYVEKDYNKYKSMIEELYPKFENWTGLRTGDPVPEIYTRLAGIRKQEGKMDEAIELYFNAKEFLIERIVYNPFFGNLTIMKWLEKDLYSIYEFDEDDFDLYDLYYLFEHPAKVTFFYKNEKQTVEAVLEDGGIVICLNGKWYRTVDDLMAKGQIDGELLTSIYEDLYGYEIVTE